MKKPDNMTAVEWKAYQARKARRAADPGYNARVEARGKVVEVPVVEVPVVEVPVVEVPVVEVPVVTAPVVETIDYEAMTKKELLKLAAEKGFALSDKLSKTKLIAELTK